MEEKNTIKMRSWQEVLEGGLHKQPIQERIDSMTYVKPFVIKEIDMLTIKRVERFSKMHSKGDWGIGLRLMTELIDTDTKYSMLFTMLNDLADRVESIEAMLAQPQEETEKKPKVFGGGK